MEISLRRRQEHEAIEKQVNEIKTRLHQQSSSTLTTNNETSLFGLLMTKYRRPVYIGIVTLFTGSLLLYKYASYNNHNH